MNWRVRPPWFPHTAARIIAFYASLKFRTHPQNIFELKIE